MSLRVVIPTAGLGQRLQDLTKNLNKSLVTIANKPVISHIIDTFPDKTEFVIPIGYQGNKVKEFLKLAYPKKIFFFVKVNKFQGKGSGLGLTLLKSKKYLQKPFIFVSCDTIFKGKIPNLKNNWVGFDNSKLSSSYRKISIKKKIVHNFYKKDNRFNKTQKNYIGLAGIKDFKIFWDSMENKKKSIVEGEVCGLKDLIPQGIKCYKFKWYDTGNIKSLNQVKLKIKNNKFNILDKDGEAIWFIKNKKVIKYSHEKNFIRNRVLRQNYLKNYTPNILKYGKYFYMYNMIDGKILSKVISQKLFIKFLNFLTKFWEFKKTNQKEFEKKCLKFYRDKTYKRVKEFKKKYKNYDKIELINGNNVRLVDTLLKEVDWKKISKGKSVLFHGDLHFENVLYSKKKFILLDWRQNFAGYLNKGDIYYDLSKIMHGILVSHNKVYNNYYTYTQKNKETKINIKLDKKYKNLLIIFEKWVLKNNFDLEKVIKLTALIYLNIAPLHHYPYSIFLFKLGKLLLTNKDYYKKLYV